MYQIARSNTFKLASFQTRAFTTGPTLALKVAASKSPSKSRKVNTPEVKSLERELLKEKAALSKLQEKLKKANEDGKAKRAAAAEKKRELKAFKPYRKLSGMNIFVKENYKSSGSLAQAAQGWTNLTESEKKPYVQKAERINEENLKIYAPKPAKPAPAYANFTRSNWEATETFAEASKIAAGKWKQLSKQEKDAYAPKEEEWEAYRKALDAWKEDRLKVFHSK